MIEYGTFKIDPATLPEVSVNALLRRGVAHYLGNEQASKLASWVEAEEKAGRKPGDAEKAVAKHDFQTAAIEALTKGTIGTRVGGPRGTAIDTVIRGLAKDEVKAVLKHNGLTFPTGEKVVEFADGTKLTGSELIDRRIAKHGDRLRKEAEAEMKRQERDAAKAGGVDALL